MSRLDDRLLNHEVHGLIARTRELLGQVSEDTHREADERLEGALDRVPIALDHLETLLNAADPRLVTTPALDQLAAPLNQAIEALSALASDPDQINGLDAAIESALSSSQALAVASSLPQEISKAAVKNFGTELRARAKAVSEEAEAIAKSLEALKAERDQLDQQAKEVG